MRKSVDIKLGDKFGRWTVIGDVFYKSFPSGSSAKFVSCVCDCGVVSDVRCGALTSPTKPSNSCGCLQKEIAKNSRRVPTYGEKENSLLVIEDLGVKEGRSFCKVVCDCGSEPFTVRYEAFLSGHTKSCGCLQKEVTSKRTTKHGMSHTSAYSSWQNMKDRCLNPNSPSYSNYGALGITIPQAWHTFENFWGEMSEGWVEGLDIDRIDYKQSYSKENCRWVERDVGNHNKSKHEDCTSRFKGVYYDKARDYWVARLQRNGIVHLYKRFWSELEAAEAYDNASEDVYGDRPNEKYFNLKEMT